MKKQKENNELKSLLKKTYSQLSWKKFVLKINTAEKKQSCYFLHIPHWSCISSEHS